MHPIHLMRNLLRLDEIRAIHITCGADQTPCLWANARKASRLPT